MKTFAKSRSGVFTLVRTQQYVPTATIKMTKIPQGRAVGFKKEKTKGIQSSPKLDQTTRNPVFLPVT